MCVLPVGCVSSAFHHINIEVHWIHRVACPMCTLVCLGVSNMDTGYSNLRVLVLHRENVNVRVDEFSRDFIHIFFHHSTI